MKAVMLTDCFGDILILPDPQEAATLFDEQARLVMPSGRCGQAIWVGTDDGADILRIDIDIGEGRAALRWLPDGTHAVELEPGQGIETYATDDGEIAYIPSTLARVSPATARGGGGRIRRRRNATHLRHVGAVARFGTVTR